MTTLTAEQTAGLEALEKWYGDALDGLAGPFRLFGPAGTGKTTMAKAIPDALGTTARFMAYTGKAAHVLNRKGIRGAKTIHSSIYYPVSNAETKAKLAKAREELERLELTEPIDLQHGQELTEQSARIQAEIEELEAASKRMQWELNPLAFAEDQPGVLILDEVSMVNSKLAEDLASYGIPIVVLGDPAQLPPVEGGGYYINGDPDYMLETIHRQALESPVLELATRIRLSQGPRLGMTADDLTPASLKDAMGHDQVIVWSNRKRWDLIGAMRNRMGFPVGMPVAGDRVMCLSNNKDLAIFNGAQFTVLGSTPAALGPTLRLKDDDGNERTIPAFAEGFQGLEKEKLAKRAASGIKGGRGLFTFSQAITCHKSQGSEWDSVYVVNELPNMMGFVTKQEGAAKAEAQARQWAYTAVTRAANRVTITAPKPGR